MPATAQDRHFYRNAPACRKVKQIGSASTKPQSSFGTLERGLGRLLPAGKKPSFLREKGGKKNLWLWFRLCLFLFPCSVCWGSICQARHLSQLSLNLHFYGGAQRPEQLPQPLGALKPSLSNCSLGRTLSPYVIRTTGSAAPVDPQTCLVQPFYLFVDDQTAGFDALMVFDKNGPDKEIAHNLVAEREVTS